MGVSKQQAIENRRAIVTAAEALFRERGVDAVGLTELTKAAGFTQGGFYNHFKSKADLVAAVIEQATERGCSELGAAIENSKAQAAEPMERQVDWYLSSGHRADIALGCPLAVFAGDVRRLDAQAQKAYAKGLENNFEQLARIVARSSARAKRKKAIALFSQMVGAMVLSRAVLDVDPALADEILKDGRDALHQSIGD
ncbi:TetR/AcrR family transcriptional regulator [Dyella sp. A6]|uniref:TetR/AcrR family transcriptional regulator n=1 Tax=Dyella aluminiiresistens TaxID=3069105 RepID=UPI002E772DE1|nr:TetR family transcriptional regulator [Dyella sp. A6]